MARKNEFGGSWWATQFNKALEDMGWASRLSRGRSYARKGAVQEIKIFESQVSAQVRGTSPWPYQVDIYFRPLTDKQWKAVIGAMASQARFAASLLVGEMPRDIEEVFKETNVSLFPGAIKDINARCTCPDSANPCKHIAAVYYLLGQRFDEDPFLLFELRGFPREELLSKLAEERQTQIEKEKSRQKSKQTAAKGNSQSTDKPGQKDSKAITKLLPGNSVNFLSTLMKYGENEAINPSDSGFWKVGKVVEYQPVWQIPHSAALFLQQQGPPPNWKGPEFMTTMHSIYQITSENSISMLEEAGILSEIDSKDETGEDNPR